MAETPSRHTAAMVRAGWMRTSSDIAFSARSRSRGSLTSATSVSSAAREPPAERDSSSHSFASSRSTLSSVKLSLIAASTRARRAR